MPYYAKRLRPCASFASFYLRVLHVMECCSCYCCCNCCCYPSYCIVSLFASYLDFLSIAPARYISFSFVACSLNARVILSSSHSLHPHFSISLRSLLSFWDESHPKLFPNLSSSGDL